MTREELIRKWLDNELSAQEQKAFEQLEDHDDLIVLSKRIKGFQAPEFNIEQSHNALMSRIQTAKKQRGVNWQKYVLRIAAVLVIAFGAYFFTLTQDTNVSTLMAEKTTIALPDDSEVVLNSQSVLSFNERDWKSSRDIELNGEAFFKVAKGKSFNVMTSAGTVTVLGTQFNVKHREGIFEVVCFEGSVEVKSSSRQVVLKPGDQFLLLDGKYIAAEKDKRQKPSWIDNESYFKSMPYGLVVTEFERQYDVEINIDSVDTDQRFTGSFTHNNIDLALKSITLPLNLKYRLTDGRTIMLSRE
ncbi:MAG: DUF4974 domain-containing protein [Flavobacteriaceae bacterium]|nr:DUF4974 domain-containing protein [Flavobacteriaceae bacterium]NNK72580.1 DUF4974 domain-containing protein [Flavobacteriaceae bacterium]